MVTRRLAENSKDTPRLTEGLTEACRLRVTVCVFVCSGAPVR